MVTKLEQALRDGGIQEAGRWARLAPHSLRISKACEW